MTTGEFRRLGRCFVDSEHCRGLVGEGDTNQLSVSFTSCLFYETSTQSTEFDGIIVSKITGEVFNCSA